MILNHETHATGFKINPIASKLTDNDIKKLECCGHRSSGNTLRKKNMKHENS